jgi:hypothetical protein
MRGLVGWLALACLGLDASGTTFEVQRGGPRLVLWAWERPEDLRFIARDDVAVAFLASTVHLDEGAARVERRRQPLRVAPGAHLVAVVRVDARRRVEVHTDAQRASVVGELSRVASLPGVEEVQVDFDAGRTQRDFYVGVVEGSRAALPARVRLSVTALASWCLHGSWLDALPVDEVVPMLFTMGPDADGVWRTLRSEGDFPSERCRSSVGISMQEEPRWLPAGRRLYAFNARPWDQTALDHAWALRDGEGPR